MSIYGFMWKDLNGKEYQCFQEYARKNYKPLSPINGTWHPVTQLEAIRINLEHVGASIDVKFSR